MHIHTSDRVRISVIFLAHGLMVATLAPHIPYIRDKFELSEGALGMLLLSVAVGAVAAMIVTGSIASRIGADVVTRWSTPLMAGALVLPFLAPTPGALAITLVVFGAAIGSMDVSMNAVAAEIETSLGRAVMSSFHGMFSVGAVVGSLGAAAFLRTGTEPFFYAAVLASFVAVATWPFVTRLPESVTVSDKVSMFRVPRGRLLLIGFIAFAVMLAEGAAFDWSATYLNNDLGSTTAIAALAFGAFSFTMAIGRFTGDAVVRRVGRKTIVQTGAALAMIGLSIGLLTATPLSAILGFAVMGAGLANIIPVVFTTAAAHGVTPAEGISGTATFGYFGFLLGPPLIGFIAELTNLTIGLAAVALLLAVIALAGSALPSERSDPSISF